MKIVVYFLLIFGLFLNFSASAAALSKNIANTSSNVILCFKKEKESNKKRKKGNSYYRKKVLNKNARNTHGVPHIIVAKSSFHVLIDDIMAGGVYDGTELEDLYHQIGKNLDQFRNADSLNPFIAYVVEHYGENMWTPTLITQLVAHGAHLNGVNPETGHGPLHMAILKQDKKLFEQLLDAQADFNATNKDGQTPLHVACMMGRLDVVERLIKEGGDVNARDNKYAVPLHFVMGRSLSKKMRSSFKFPCQRGDQVAHSKYLVQIETRKKIIDALCNKDAWFDPIDTNDRTPYDIACQEAHLNLASYIENKQKAASSLSATIDDAYDTSSTDEEDNNS